MKLHKILLIAFLLLFTGSVVITGDAQAREKTAHEIFFPLNSQYGINADGTIVYSKTFASATDVDTSSSTRSNGYAVSDAAGWFSIAEYPRIAVTAVVSDTQKVKIIVDYRAGASSVYQTYDAAGDTVSTIGTTSTGKAGTVTLRSHSTDNIPGANYIRVRLLSITGSEYDDPAYVYLYRGQ